VTAGCASLSQREVVVVFGQDSTPAQHRAARDACSGFENASPEPLPTSSRYASERLSDVRFRVDKASDGQINDLYTCLRKQPGVVGVNIPDTTQ
jgi:hypothetical protein